VQYLTRDEVRELDRHAIEDLRIPGMVLMENAGRGVTNAVQELLAGVEHPSVAVVAGRGNNGGDGYVVARHLANAGVPVTVYLVCEPADLTGDAKTNFDIISRMEIPVVCVNGPSDLVPAANAGVIVDAILGTGLSGEVREPYHGVIRFLNELSQPIVAVDIPSGLDCDTGEPLGVAVRATRTVSFVAAKKGFANPDSAAYTGEVIVDDVGGTRGNRE